MKNLRLFLWFVLCLVFFSSCTLQKRNYRKGYYLSWNNSKNKLAPVKKENKLKDPETEKGIQNTAEASVHKEPALSIEKKSPLLNLNEECGDSLFFKSGSVSKVKVYEISETEIKYKRCANLEGPMISVYTSTVLKVKYANGEVTSYKDVQFKDIKEKVKGEQPSTNKEDKILKTGLGHAAFIPLALLVFFIMLLMGFSSPIYLIVSILPLALAIYLAVRAIILACKRLKKIKHDPELPGKRMARAAIILTALSPFLGLVFLYLVLFVLLLLFGF